jgi:hypothetical protein
LGGEPRIDIRGDRRGEYFALRFAGGDRTVELEVVDIHPRERHLLLPARVGEDKSKFLCGHDERHWFVAAIPEAARGVTGVVAAKAALQPQAVRDLIERRRPKDPFRRRNAAYLRQGEWFFVPAVGIDPRAALVLRDEPLMRGARQHAVRHPDHATIRFAGWYRVLMNTEQGGRAMRHVAFID